MNKLTKPSILAVAAMVAVSVVSWFPLAPQASAVASYDAATVATCKKTILKRGSRGACVKVAQAKLNAYQYCNTGSRVLSEDGVFGAKTERYVKIFQASKGYKADGIVGARTWHGLERPCSDGY